MRKLLCCLSVAVASLGATYQFAPEPQPRMRVIRNATVRLPWGVTLTNATFWTVLDDAALKSQWGVTVDGH